MSAGLLLGAVVAVVLVVIAAISAKSSIGTEMPPVNRSP